MTKQLIKAGNSEALVLSKDMKAHLGLTDNRIEVRYVEGQIILTRPEARIQTFEEALEGTVKQYDQAFRNLAK